MKIRDITFSVSTLVFVGSVQARGFDCTATGARGGSGALRVSSHLHFKLKMNRQTGKPSLTEEEEMVFSDFIGHVRVAQEDTRPSGVYYSVFVKKDLKQDFDFNPRKYVNYSKFTLKQTASNTFDGGGMNGYIVVAPNFYDAKESFDVHYIFQSGDHVGGTIDYTCSR